MQLQLHASMIWCSKLFLFLAIFISNFRNLIWLCNRYLSKKKMRQISTPRSRMWTISLFTCISRTFMLNGDLPNFSLVKKKSFTFGPFIHVRVQFTLVIPCSFFLHACVLLLLLFISQFALPGIKWTHLLNADTSASHNIHWMEFYNWLCYYYLCKYPLTWKYVVELCSIFQCVMCTQSVLTQWPMQWAHLIIIIIHHYTPWLLLLHRSKIRESHKNIDWKIIDPCKSLNFFFFVQK